MEKKKTFLKKLANYIFGEAVKIRHPFFGELTDPGDCFEGKKIFLPTGTEVEFRLDKISSGPTEKQVAFVQQLERDYAKLREQVVRELERDIVMMLPNYRVENFEKAFSLEYLSIPDCEQSPIEWEITYYEREEIHHWFTIEMKEMKVLSISMDG